MNPLDETRISELMKLRREKFIEEIKEKKQKQLREAVVSETDLLRKELEQKTNQLQNVTKLLITEKNVYPKINGVADNIKDLKVIRARKENLEKFLSRWPEPKRDLNSTTIPCKQRQLKFWIMVESLYFSEEWFGAMKHTLESGYHNTRGREQHGPFKSKLKTEETVPSKSE